MTEISGETSDGYHTFNELYRFRLPHAAPWDGHTATDVATRLDAYLRP